MNVYTPASQKHVGNGIATEMTPKFAQGVIQIVRISCKTDWLYLFLLCRFKWRWGRNADEENII